MSGDPHTSGRVRVLVADDSAFMRTALRRMIESDPALSVIDTAQTGLEALEKVAAQDPDVVTLDVEMPGMNGLETLNHIMADFPRPVLMVSSLTQEGAETTLEALDHGAFDCIPKQQSYACLDIVKIRDDLVAKIRAAAETRRRRIPAASAKKTANRAANAGPLAVTPAVVAVGTSTGGPKALQQILPQLPQDLGVGVLVVQHMPPGFTGPFARRLDHLCRISVREAAHGEPVEPGVVYIAPAGRHMTVARSSLSKITISLSQFPEGTLHRPSADVMMASVADVFGGLSMGIIMTGMGADGLQGMTAIARAGGLTIGQDAESCIVYGMPRSCAEAGILQRSVPLNSIPEQILRATRYRPHR